VEERVVLPLRDPPLLVNEDVGPRGDRAAALREKVALEHHLGVVKGGLDAD
jgi:hypothetical protein